MKRRSRIGVEHVADVYWRGTVTDPLVPGHVEKTLVLYKKRWAWVEAWKLRRRLERPGSR